MGGRRVGEFRICLIVGCVSLVSWLLGRGVAIVVRSARVECLLWYVVPMKTRCELTLRWLVETLRALSE